MGLSEHTALYTLMSAVVIVAMNPFVADASTGYDQQRSSAVYWAYFHFHVRLPPAMTMGPRRLGPAGQTGVAMPLPRARKAGQHHLGAA